MFNYDIFIKRIHQTCDFLEKNNISYELRLGEPATEREIAKIQQLEQEYGLELPTSIKKVFKEFSSNFLFTAGSYNETIPHFSKELTFQFKLEWSIDFIIENIDLHNIFKETQQTILETFNCNEETLFQSYYYDWIEYQTYHNTFPIFDNGGGSLVCISVNNQEEQTIYMNENPDETDVGILLGFDFLDFLDRTSQLFFVGCDYENLQHFIGEERLKYPLDTSSEKATELKRIIGITN